MSILSQLLNRKITFDQAVQEAAQWFDALLAHAPAPIQQGVSQALSDFKQAAGNAVALADTALGPILATANLAVNVAVNTAINTAVGPAAGGQLTPAVDAGIDSIVNALHAEIDAVAAAVRAKLVTPPAASPATEQNH
ncbi:MAG: hypothetical protein ACXWCO_00665 [Caldimonas sp.]